MSPMSRSVPLLCCLLLAGGCGAERAERVADAGSAASTTAAESSPAVSTPTAFHLPSDFDTWLQSPVVAPDPAVLAVPGVSIGRFQGLEAVLVETPLATAAVSLVGGQLLSWVPAGQEDVFWLSPLRAELPTPIRGGAPVCWPYFSRHGQGNDVPSHGFVRTLPWTLVSAARENDGTVVLELAPPALQDLALGLRMQLRIGRQLEQRLITTNNGAEAVRYTEALHNYFHVADVGQVRIEGLAGRRFLDKNDGGNAHVQQGEWTLHDPRDPGRSDRLFPDAGGAYRLVDPGLRRHVEVSVEGGRTAVVWNPGEAAAARMADVGPHWRGFVCLEAANAGPDLVELAPGQTHVLVQRIAVAPLD